MKFRDLLREPYFLLLAATLVVLGMLLAIRETIGAEIIGATLTHWLERSIN